jgi:hypothetical protein
MLSQSAGARGAVGKRGGSRRFGSGCLAPEVLSIILIVACGGEVATPHPAGSGGNEPSRSDATRTPASNATERPALGDARDGGTHSLDGSIRAPDDGVPIVPDDAAAPNGRARIIIGDSGTALNFVPSSVSATRDAPTCDDPPFTDADAFMLTVEGTRAGSNDPLGTWPYDGFSVDLTGPTPPLDEPRALPVMAFSRGDQGATSGGAAKDWSASQSADDGHVRFIYAQFRNPGEIDTGAFDSVVVTLLSVPAKNGDPFTVHVHVHFVDGKVLDGTFWSPVVTYTRCVAG